MFTSTGRSLGAISRRKENGGRRREDGKRKERHIEWEGEREGQRVRDGVTNKEKQSVEH